MIPRAELRDLLRRGRLPGKPEQIGISPERLRVSFRKAYHIRRRFTILDLVRRANLWDHCLDQVFSAGERRMNATRRSVASGRVRRAQRLGDISRAFAIGSGGS